MTQLYDKLTGRTLRRVDKAIGLIEKHLFNFDGNKEVIKWIPRSPGFIDFEGHDPISNALVKGGFEHDNRGRVKSYFALTDLNNTIPDFYFGVALKGNGFKRHIKATDTQSSIAEGMLAKYEGQWNQATYHIVNWLDDLPGTIRKKDDSTWAYFEGFDTIYA